MYTSATWVGLSLLALGMIAAGAPQAKQPACHPTTGQVFYEGKPAVGAVVVFHPQGDEADPKIMPVGETDKNGKFSLTTFKKEDGGPAGDYKVTVVLIKPKPKDREILDPLAKSYLPAKYGDRSTTPLRVTVKEGRNELPRFDLKR
jgi:hypothetical protein